MSDATHTDGRREAGIRTKERLIEATRTLVAAHGEGSVSLRAITEAAGTNVAAVSYHFGSKDALVRAAVESSLDRLQREQVEELEALDNPTVEEIAAAWSAPVIRAVASSPCSEHVFMRAIGRTLTSCSGERREQLEDQAALAEGKLVGAVSAALPGLDYGELRFRVTAANSVLFALTTGAAGLDGESEAELERLVVPVVAGALAGFIRSS
jgi:AcrR family transcriptional regulator